MLSDGAGTAPSAGAGERIVSGKFVEVDRGNLDFVAPEILTRLEKGPDQVPCSCSRLTCKSAPTLLPTVASLITHLTLVSFRLGCAKARCFDVAGMLLCIARHSRRVDAPPTKQSGRRDTPSARRRPTCGRRA